MVAQVGEFPEEDQVYYPLNYLFPEEYVTARCPVMFISVISYLIAKADFLYAICANEFVRRKRTK